MKTLKYIILFFLLTLYQTVSAQSGTWVWLKGSDTAFAVGNFGIKGVSSPLNEPRSRYQCAYWKDLKGNFWIFGGVGASNDLWKYNPTSNEWVWVRGNTTAPIYGTMGVPSALNNPPKLGYGANCWTDASGDLWLFAGYNISSPGQNDVLWRYNIANDEWTWMKGNYTISSPAIYGTKGIAAISNTPGIRQECKSAWVYGNKLWLFGGIKNAGSAYNDLWQYDIATNNWTWESGTNIINSSGNYGTKGIPAATNAPPSRLSYTRWQDGNNNFYLFAGQNAGSALLNDIWQYNTSTKLWTWISGTNKLNDSGTAAGFCIPDTNNTPHSRFENQTAEAGNTCNIAFWNFGGLGLSGGVFNDLWLFNIRNYEWTKVKGGFGTPPPYSFGIKGVPNVSNLPKGRGGPAVWSDKTGAIYIFGGLIFSTMGEYSNDLWKFIPDESCFKTGLVGGVKLEKPSDTQFCAGDTLKIAIPLNSTVVVKPAVGVSIDYLSGYIKFYQPEGIHYTVISNSKDPDDPCAKTDTIHFFLSEFPKPKAEFKSIPLKAIIDNPNFNFINTSTDAVRYEWYYKGTLVSTDKDFLYKFPSIGKHCLTLIAINKCERKDTFTNCVYVLDTGKFRSRDNLTLCAGDTTVINIPEGTKIEVIPNIDYTIDTALGVLFLFPDKTTTYTINTASTDPDDSLFVKETFHITINVNQPPIAKFDISPIIAFKTNPKFNFINKSVEAISYEWYYDGQLISTDKDISKTFPEEGEYCLTLVVTNICNRKDSSTQCCWVYAKGKLIIPNAFTPNGDGINDGFKPLLSTSYTTYSIVIMNRWGQEVFNADSPNKIWDGSFNGVEEEMGVYYYLIKIKYGDGEAEEMYKGDITLIR